jgi:hypothetical protein
MLKSGGNPFVQHPISVMRSEHVDHGAALDKLNALTNDATPPAGACNTWRALYSGIAQLNDDLINHIHLENNVLFPAFEAQAQKAMGGGGCGERGGGCAAERTDRAPLTPVFPPTGGDLFYGCRVVVCPVTRRCPPVTALASNTFAAWSPCTDHAVLHRAATTASRLDLFALHECSIVECQSAPGHGFAAALSRPTRACHPRRAHRRLAAGALRHRPTAAGTCGRFGGVHQPSQTGQQPWQTTLTQQES